MFKNETYVASLILVLLNLGIVISIEPKLIASISLFYNDLIIFLSKTFYEEINSIVKVDDMI